MHIQVIEERRGTYSYAPEGGGKVEFSTLEIYNEEIRDLLLPGKDQKLDIRQGERGLFVQDLCMEQVRSILCLFLHFLLRAVPVRSRSAHGEVGGKGAVLIWGYLACVLSR